MANAYPPGTYTLTSKNINYVYNANGTATISAECKDVNGNYVANNDVGYGIVNDNGVLKWAPGQAQGAFSGDPLTPQPQGDGAAPFPPGNYLNTSKDISFEPNPKVEGNHVLTAQCQKTDGSFVSATLYYGLANLNGQLTWAPWTPIGQSTLNSTPPEGQSNP